MTLTELKYIVAVARERHFGRAAEACFVARSPRSAWRSRSSRKSST
jgi:DNA-binding transcriptional LysR family regulator